MKFKKKLHDGYPGRGKWPTFKAEKLSSPATFIKLNEIRRQNYMHSLALEKLYQPVLLAKQW